MGPPRARWGGLVGRRVSLVDRRVKKEERRRRRNGVRGEAPAKFFKSGIYPVSRPRWVTGPSKMNSAHRDLPVGEV